MSLVVFSVVNFGWYSFFCLSRYKECVTLELLVLVVVGRFTKEFYFLYENLGSVVFCNILKNIVVIYLFEVFLIKEIK